MCFYLVYEVPPRIRIVKVHFELMYEYIKETKN